MANFKTGQKVVFVCDRKGFVNKDMVKPADHEIVTLGAYCPTEKKHWELIEYSKCPVDGSNNWYHENNLRPLDYSFSDKVETYIKEKVKKEQLITV